MAFQKAAREGDPWRHARMKFFDEGGVNIESEKNDPYPEKKHSWSEAFYHGFGKVLTTMESCPQRGGASADAEDVVTALLMPLTAMPRVRT